LPGDAPDCFIVKCLQVALGYNKLYNAANPFDWMELISLQGKTNFFERRVGEYQRSGVMSALRGRKEPSSTGENMDHVFSLEEDF